MNTSARAIRAAAMILAFRDGGHGYRPDDWERFLDFAAWRFSGGDRPDFDANPAIP